MTSTTIKVSTQVRDRLKASATAHGRTLGEHLEALLVDEARRERFAVLRSQIVANPPDRRYLDELAEWDVDDLS